MGLIIRTCSALLGLAIATPALASSSPLADYARARLADSAGAGDLAVPAYAAALTAAPDNSAIALRAYREAISSGDRRLAIRAAQLLDAAQLAPPDAQLVLFADMLSRGDTAGAKRAIGKLEGGGLVFLTPTLSAWTAFAARESDPLAALDSRRQDGLANLYAREHKVLLLLAMGRNADAMTVARAVAGADGRGLALRLQAAARLVALKDRAGALQLLQGNDAVTARARQMVEDGKPIMGAIDTAPAAVSALLTRVALDLMRDNASPAALTIARIASFSDTPDDPVRIALAQALSLSGQSEAGLGELDRVAPQSLFAQGATDTRIAILQRTNRNEEALALAKAALATGGSASDHARIGDALTRLKRSAEAAESYGAAIAKLESEAAPVPWNLWLLRGGALDAAGDWARGKVALKKAVELGPQEPEALNHLGYAMLERGENLDEATRLIARASALRPSDPAITDSLGWAWFKRGDLVQSIPILEAAAAGDPTISEIAEHLGDAYWTAGRRVDARYSWRAALVQADAADDRTRLQAKLSDGLPRAKP